MQSWLSYLASKRIQNTKRERLQTVLSAVDGTAALKEYFNVWSFYAQECKDFLKDARIMLIENAMGRLFKAWKAYTDERALKRQVLRHTEQQIASKRRRIYLVK